MKSVREAELESKRICVFRCLHAILLSAGIQLYLLTVFLLFANFSLIHPISWFTETLSLIFSFYTWIYLLPLIIAVILYGIYLGNSCLAAPKYYSSRFKRLYSTGLRKLSSFFMNLIMGFLTAWMYTRFLNEAYSTLFHECFDSNNYCLNGRYVFLTLGGVFSALYFFIRERLTKEPEIIFNVLHESKRIQIRSAIYKIVYSSLLNSITPVICYTVFYLFFGSFITGRLANLFVAEHDENLESMYSILTNCRTIFYLWILASQILSNMYLMDTFFYILLAEPVEFTIEKNPIVNQQRELILTDALTLSSVPIIRQLAALDLFQLSIVKNSIRRQQIFTLSVPGGHPYNWEQLCSQCLSILNSFTDELSHSVKKISTVKSSSDYLLNKPTIKPTATDTAEKILLRQYNETFRIRNMTLEKANMSINCNKQTVKNKTAPLVEFWRSFDDLFNAIFKSVPGIFYLFGEPDGAKTTYLLANSQDIYWISQGLAGLCACSLFEDKFGVVQSKLPDILCSLLRLKLELDKLNNVNLNGKRFDRNCISLKSSVKRSLYKICTVFSEYLSDLIDDTEKLRQLQHFVNYQN